MQWNLVHLLRLIHLHLPNLIVMQMCHTNYHIICNLYQHLCWCLLSLLLLHGSMDQYLCIQCEVRKKSWFCKCLRFSKSEFSRFSNVSGQQKWPALPESECWSVVVMETTITYILILLLNYIPYYMLEWFDMDTNGRFF